MSADIRLCRGYDAAEMAGLFDSLTGTDDFIYLPLSEDEIKSKFLDDSDGISKKAVGMFDHGALSGFASGCEKGGKRYVTMLAVKASRRGEGIGGALLSRLESELGPGPYEASFYDPIQLSWAVPGTDGRAMHNNSPGVDISSDAYGFFGSRGYMPWAVEYSYYLPLTGYGTPDGIKTLAGRLAEEGITAGYYDPAYHHGFDHVCDSTGFTGWKDAVRAELKKPDPRPVLCLFDGDRVIGSTGYISAPPGGRGFFLGVGVAPEYRGRGCGKLMFSFLCSELKRMGAGYMTLFTGEENMSARRIYEAAGFTHVRSWALMRKA